MDEVVGVPALVKGRVVMPDGEHVSVVRVPVLDQDTLAPTGAHRSITFPLVPPEELVEPDPGALAAGLHALPFHEVLQYADGLRTVLRPGGALSRSVAADVAAATSMDGAAVDLFLGSLPGLFDPNGLAELVDRELGNGDGPGRDFLDGWVPVPATPARGRTARAADQLAGRPPRAAYRAAVRAVPTRQLHITAGNTPVIPFVSFLRALATKGAAVVKCAAGSAVSGVVLARAMHELDPDHPITRHTSLVYWPGGDRRVEDVLLADGAFDRLVMWGSADAIGSVVTRAVGTRQVLLRPRVGISLIGGEALTDVAAAADRAAADTMIAGQAACTSSLVHYVEGSRQDAADYCEALRGALARWDRALPRALDPGTVARLRRLRRGEFVAGTWFENGQWPHVTSVVVLLPSAFDLAAHPMGRCVVVRPVARLADALRYTHAGVSAVGVWPLPRLVELRDELVARGVSTVLPLGETEQAYAGMPHDGMRVLSELVNWVNSAVLDR
jgi:hypothetical protein